MVRGLDLFRQRFRQFEGSFVLIGGAARDEWFASLGLTFRVTKDLDIVLIIEILAADTVKGLRAFIADGGYEIRQRTTGAPVLYRFAKPKNEEFPFMLEFFSRKPARLQLAQDQEIVPIPSGSDHHSLSAILLDQDYYSLIQTHTVVWDGPPFATATSLIPMKARAWVDLTKRKAGGRDVDSKDIVKHRSDVFRLAGTLPGEPGPPIPTKELVHDVSSAARNTQCPSEYSNHDHPSLPVGGLDKFEFRELGKAQTNFRPAFEARRPFCLHNGWSQHCSGIACLMLSSKAASDRIFVNRSRDVRKHSLSFHRHKFNQRIRPLQRSFRQGPH